MWNARWGRQAIELPVLRIPRKFQTAANRRGLLGGGRHLRSTWNTTRDFCLSTDVPRGTPGEAARRRSRRFRRSSNIADSDHRCGLPGRRVFHVEHATRDSSHLPPPGRSTWNVCRGRQMKLRISMACFTWNARPRFFGGFAVPRGTLDESEGATFALRHNIDSPAFESSNSRPNDMITT